ncbi:HAD-IIB family hydrolase [Thermophilibacter sp.]
MPNNGAPVVAFFDVDGTLTCRDYNDGLHVVPTPRVQEAVRAFVGAGNVAVVCTGRSILNIEDLLDLPFSGFVTLDGTHVELGGEVVYDRTIERGLFRETVAEMRRVGVEALFEGTYGNVLVRGRAGGLSMFGDQPEPEDYERAGGRIDFGKIDFNDESLDACLGSDLLMGSYTYLNVGEGSHELAIPGTSKGVGGRALLDALGFEPSRVYAFGDSENDLEILDLADVSVVMGNARDVVKERADYVTDDVHDDGVVTALEHFGLI